MRLINRTDPAPAKKLFWRTFASDDGSHFIGLDQGRLKWNEIQSVNAKQNSVQIEIKWSGLRGDTMVSASKSKKFKNTSTIIIVNHKLVEIEAGGELDSFLKLGGWDSSYNSAHAKQITEIPIDFSQVLSFTMTLVDGIAVGFAQTSVALGLAKGGVGLAMSIMGMFGEDTQLEPFGLFDISKSLKNVIDESEAQSEAAKIIAACKWFEFYVLKSAELSNKNEQSIELNDYDKKQFIDELDEHLDLQTPFLESMAVLNHKNKVRLYAIPQFIMGAMLHLNLERLNLVVKKQTTTLDVHDINKVIKIAESYINDLQKSENDFISKRNEHIKKYPLMGEKWEDFTTQKPTKDNSFTIIQTNPEADFFGRGMTVKYLSGDRWLIMRAIAQIKEVIVALNSVRLN